MNLRTSPLRKLVTVAASASILATSFAVVVAPTIAPQILEAATTCVEEEGSTTVYPSLIQAQSAMQGNVTSPQPAWPTGQKLGCDVILRATGSTNGKNAVRAYYNGGSTVRHIAASSAPLSSSTGETSELMAFQVGGDAMVIAVNSNNPVNEMTAAEVTAIWNGNITTWQQLGAGRNNGKTGAIVPRSRISGSGTYDDMKRLFRAQYGNAATGACPAGFTTCESSTIFATGLPRFVTSDEEAQSVCNSQDQIAYTSLANLQKYGPGTVTCGNGTTLKALAIQGCTYPGTYTGTTDPLTLACSGAFVVPSVSTAAAGGTYPAKRELYLALPLLSELVSKHGTGNGTGWTDQLGVTKAFDIVNYMSSTQGQQAQAAVNFIPISVPAKQPIPDADIDLNGGIGLTDIGQITGRWNRTDTIPGTVRADVDNNGGVGLSDIGRITGQWGAAGFVAP